jgi:hypothetical protein
VGVGVGGAACRPVVEHALLQLWQCRCLLSTFSRCAS